MTRTVKMKIGLGAALLAILGIIFASLYPFDEVQAPATPAQENNTLTEAEIKNKNFVPECDEASQEQCAIKEFSNEISREEAKKLILEGKVTSLFQAHSLEVRLTIEEGEFSTREPKIDEVWKVRKECGSLCSKMVLSTE